MTFNLKENEFEFYAYWLDDMDKGGGREEIYNLAHHYW